MIVLNLNPMTGQAEQCVAVARAQTREQLEQFLKQESVESYTDGQWRKSFRRGGPLEWFNPPDGDFFFKTFVDVGTEDDWAARAREDYRRLLNEVPSVDSQNIQ